MSDRPIALVGFPGAGKTRTGRVLAALLSLPFVDTDEEVERRAGRSIRELFQSEGEGGFRTREREVVKELGEGVPKVMALGGGAFDDEASRALLLERCTVIWLDVPADILIERLRDSSHRPLLDGSDPDAMLRHLAYRRRFYGEAHMRVSGTTSGELVDRIMPAIGRAGRSFSAS